MSRSIAIVIGAVLAVGAAASAFEFLVSDSATRIAYAIRNGTVQMKLTSADTLTVTVAGRSWPDGCPGGYRVTFTADGEPYPGLGVACTTSRRSYGTTYYRNFVKVPQNLAASHARDEATSITLRRAADGAIEVVALR